MPAFAAPFDTDDDGIPDSVDKCNDLKEDYLGKNRFDGCPAPQEVPPAEQPETPLAEPTVLESADAEPQTVMPDEQNNSVAKESETMLESLTQSQAIPSLDFSNISEDALYDYFGKIINNITKESSIYDLIGFSIGMVVYGVFIFHFYRFLAKRDMFSLKIEERLTRGKLKSSGEKISAAPRIAAYIATNIFIFPIIIFLWFLAYSSFMFFLAQDMTINTVFLVSSSLIIAIRIAAYYNEDLSRDLAKLLPFALLGIFLLSPTFFSIDEITQRLSGIPNFVIQIAAFLVVAMIIETILSLLYLLKVRIVGHKEKKTETSDAEQPI